MEGARASASMAEEPSLPALPAASWDERSRGSSKGPRKRQRPIGQSNFFYSSSDPAVFSSDDDPGLDNYISGRNKRQYIGSWYHQQPASSDSAYGGDSLPLPKPKRTLKRQLDSGVYLGSDGTDTDDMLEPPPPSVITTPTRPIVVRPPMSRISEAEKTAREKIRLLLEQGEESLDFWSMGLRELSNETISPLAQLSHIPQVTKDVAFEHKEPELKMYLARNSLLRLPGALFDLRHLTVLSVRENNLADLPPAICQLTNLTELNLAQNRLRCLPAEFLDLCRPDAKLKKLVLFPNPFFRPAQALEHDAPVEATAVRLLSDWQPHFLSRHLGRSQLQISTSQGQILSKFTFFHGESSGALNVWTPLDEEGSVKPSKVPSLMEAALRSCGQLMRPSELSNYVPEGLEHLRKLIDRTSSQKLDGGLMCSGCRKALVRPPLEWVEWRQLYVTVKIAASDQTSIKDKLNIKPLSMAKDEMAVPFKHRGCSWTCRPRPERPEQCWGEHAKAWKDEQ